MAKFRFLHAVKIDDPVFAGTAVASAKMIVAPEYLNSKGTFGGIFWLNFNETNLRPQ